mgnify:CR=1 FL=1
MKAAVYAKYGAPEVLQIKTVAKPSPKDNEILIKIHATAVTSADSRLRQADPFAVRFIYGLFSPKKSVLGAAMPAETLQGLWANMTGRAKVLSGVATETADAVVFLKKMAEEGRLTSLIGKKDGLEQIAQAHAHVDTGRKKGNVVIVV